MLSCWNVVCDHVNIGKKTVTGRQRTTDTPQTGDQVRPPAEEDGKEPDRGEDQQEEGRSPPVVRRRP